MGDEFVVCVRERMVFGGCNVCGVLLFRLEYGYFWGF